MDTKVIENAWHTILHELYQGDNYYKKAPALIADSYGEIFAGMSQNPAEFFASKMPATSQDLVIERNIKYYSMCEHHFLPFFGTIAIAYEPSEYIIGFGSLLRLVACLSRRPQIQERLTSEIARIIYEELHAKGVMVIATGTHMCMHMRGARTENAEIVTKSVLGEFSMPISEILALIQYETK